MVRISHEFRVIKNLANIADGQDKKALKFWVKHNQYEPSFAHKSTKN